MEKNLPMPNKKNYPVVEVCWVDAEENGDVGWNDLKEQLAYAKKPPPTMKSVGYLVFKSDTHLALLSTIGTKECSTLEKIPNTFVQSITTLSAENNVAAMASNKPLK